MSQVKAVFYLPLQDNDGRDLTAEAEVVKTELYIQFAAAIPGESQADCR